MITAYSLGRKKRWMAWALSMKGCRERKGAVSGGGTTCRTHTHTPAAGWFQKQDGNTRLEGVAN